MQTRYSKYYPLIQKLNEKFNFFLNESKKIKNKEEKNQVLSSLIEFAVYHNIGIWTSSYIEKFYTDWSKTLHLKNSKIEYKKGSFLHVLTTGYLSGGHTRVVERWIDNAPVNQQHSVVITNPSDKILFELENNVKKKNGNYILFDKNLTQEQKALKLRELALNFEYIVLHSHMEDVVPLLAFGCEEFTRPVLLYNHGSHMFWLGKSIADLVLDIIKDDKVTTFNRNINNTFFLGVPSKKITFSNPDKLNIRKKLGLPLDKKIIISAASEQKYNLPDENPIANILKNLSNEDAYCYIIGIQKNNKYWNNIQKDTNGHIKLLGYINFDEGYLDYISSADLFIDSYPWGGGAAVMDAVTMDVPVLSLKTIYPQLDYLYETEACCNTSEEFMLKSLKVLSDNEYASKLTQQLQKSLEKYQSSFAWNKRVDELLKIAPTNHLVKELSDEKDITEINDLSVLINILSDKNAFNNKSMIKNILKQNYDDFVKYGLNYKRKGIPFLFETFSFKKGGVKTKIIKLFGMKL